MNAPSAVDDVHARVTSAVGLYCNTVITSEVSMQYFVEDRFPWIGNQASAASHSLTVGSATRVGI
jgi:hypothetical protein|eukprot:COSAG01_NODE_473_length_16542_cov_42.403651_18_plen_65_part_00